MQEIGDKVSIKVQIGIYQQFRHLNNKVWYALAEYVDNAIQSFENNRERLNHIHNGDYKLSIRINIDDESITINDNAAGIGLDNYYRAFEPAHIPKDISGLHEFGMGMKTSSIWLSDTWSVRTKAIDESEERFVEFDLNQVIEKGKEELNVVKTPKSKDEHYTNITLKNLSSNAPTNPRQIQKIKDHLVSIYRIYIRKGELDLYFNGELLTYKDPQILKAPYFKDPDGDEIYWKKEINFESGNYSAKGFIGILHTMSTTENNGISLFRRGRVIVGSHDEKYRPKALCGQIGSPRYKRIFGELELSGFKVSFNKGSFVEVEDLEVLMGGIKKEISTKEFDLYNQAEKYIKPKTKEDNTQVAQKLVEELRKARSSRPLDKKQVLTAPTELEINTQARAISAVETIGTYEDKIKIGGIDYYIKQDFITDDSIDSLYDLKIIEEEPSQGYVKAEFKLNLGSNFFLKFKKYYESFDAYQPIALIVRNLVLAELHSKQQGTRSGGHIRLNFNKFLNFDE